MTILILMLANWRIAHLLASDESGPYNLLHRLRHAVGVDWIENYKVGTNEFAQLFVCIWCMSIWTGALLAFLYWLFPDFIFYLSLPFALSTVAVLVEKIVDG